MRAAKNQTEFIPTRRSLLTRLKQWDDQESWRDFFNTYWKLIYSVALKSGLTESEAQEVVQDTVVAVAKRMKEFKYDPEVGSFKSWLLVITRRRIADQFRHRPRETPFPAPRPDESARTAAEARVPDPESFDVNALWEKEWQKNIVNAAIERVKARVVPRQYQIFELYVLKEWPVDRVTKTLRVSASQVYLAKLRIGKLVANEAKKLEARML